jgi:hypothetical protein
VSRLFFSSASGAGLPDVFFFRPKNHNWEIFWRTLELSLLAFLWPFFLF